MSKLKKKLFIAGAYLIVAIILLIYVSYSAYRISIEADIMMPAAYPVEAGLKLTYNLSDGRTLDTSEYYGLELKNLSPGEHAKDYKDSPSNAAEKGRQITLVVANYASPSSASHGNASPLPQSYTISIEEQGPIPLEVYLVDTKDTSKVYKAKTTSARDSRSAVFSENPDASPVQAATFTLESWTEETDEYKLYFGWNEGTTTAQPSELIEEVAIVNIKVELTSLQPEVIINDASESNYTDKIDGYYTDRDVSTDSLARKEKPYSN